MTTIEKLIAIAIAKGVVHASIVPIVIFFTVNHFIDGGYGGIMAALWLIFTATVYKASTNKDISRLAFVWTLRIVGGAIVGIYFLGFMLAGLGG